jgi:hypothetical protein
VVLLIRILHTSAALSAALSAVFCTRVTRNRESDEGKREPRRKPRKAVTASLADVSAGPAEDTIEIADNSSDKREAVGAGGGDPNSTYADNYDLLILSKMVHPVY